MTRTFNLVTAALAVATLAGLVLLWPGEVDSQIAQGIAVETESATVERVEEGACAGFATQNCQLVTARIESGPETGKSVEIQLGGGGLDPDVDPGDDIRVAKAPEPPPGSEAVAGTGYTLYDFERRGPMLILAGLFVAGGARLRALARALSLAGLAISLVLVLVFVVPAILDGKDAAAGGGGRCARHRADHDPAGARLGAEEPRRAPRQRGEPDAHGAAGAALHEPDPPHRAVERGGDLPPDRRAPTYRSRGCSSREW